MIDWTERDEEGRYVPVQWDLRDRPFWLLVACVLMNRAGGHQAKPVLEEMMLFWPEPKHVAAAEVMCFLDEIIRPCGFQHQRSRRIGRLAAQWLLDGYDIEPPTERAEVLALSGCGKYAADSYEMFVLGRQVDDPGDHVLRDWQERHNSGGQPRCGHGRGSD